MLFDMYLIVLKTTDLKKLMMLTILVQFEFTICHKIEQSFAHENVLHSVFTNAGSKKAIDVNI